MAEEKDTAAMMATLNETIDILNALKSGGLGRLIGGARGAAATDGCQYDCGCNQSMCGCRGSIKSSVMDTVSFPEFMKIREERLAELKREMQQLDVPEQIR
jgi:hypothetical protein